MVFFVLLMKSMINEVVMFKKELNEKPNSMSKVQQQLPLSPLQAKIGGYSISQQDKDEAKAITANKWKGVIEDSDKKDLRTGKVLDSNVDELDNFFKIKLKLKGSNEVENSANNNNNNASNNMNSYDYRDSFKENMDDSSDEDEIKEYVATYDIKKEWKNYSQSDSAVKLTDQLVFLAHAAGFSVYYDPTVEKAYRKLKGNKLSVPSTDFIPEKIYPEEASELLKNIIWKTCYEMITSEDIKQTLTEVLIDKLKHAAFSGEIINQITASLKNYPRLLFRRRKFGEDYEASSVEIKLLDQIFFELKENMKKILFYDLENINIHASLPLQKMKEDQAVIRVLYEQLVKKEAWAIIKNNNLNNGDKVALSAEKKKNLAKVGKSENNPKFQKKLLELIKPALGNMYIENLLDGNVTAITSAYIEDVIAVELDGNLKEVQSNSWLTEHDISECFTLSTLSDYNPDLIKNYLPHDINELKAIIDKRIDNFPYFFVKNLQEFRKKIPMPFNVIKLGVQYFSEHHNAADVIANQRLINRSQTRIFQRFSLEKKELVRKIDNQRAWHYAATNHTVQENQEITIKFKRKDKLVFFTSYNELYNKDMKKIVAVDGIIKPGYDKTLAEGIRHILNNDKEKLEEALASFFGNTADLTSIITYLTDLTHLMFGTEPTRNQGSLVINHMLLELMIIPEKALVTWEQALASEPSENYKGGMLPMSMSKAVRAARWLNKEIASYLPYYCQYEGNQPQDVKAIAELKRRESVIVSLWITYCSKSKIQLRENGTLFSGKQLQQLFDEIKERIQTEWFQFNSTNNNALLEQHADFRKLVK